MNRLIIQKSYLRNALVKMKFTDAERSADHLVTTAPRTAFDTFWFVYLISFVNQLGNKNDESDKSSFGMAETVFEDDDYKGYYFDGLSLTFSTVGCLPEQVNLNYVEHTHNLPLAKNIFASYMVLLAANYHQNKFDIDGIKPKAKEDAVASFSKLYSFLKLMDPYNPMILLYDICLNAVSLNADNMLSFNMDEIIEFFKERYEVDLTRCNFKSIEYLSRVDGVDILAMLENTEQLYPEDLEYFITELETGGNYDEVYVKRCKKKIEELRNPKKKTAEAKTETKKSSVFVSKWDLVPGESDNRSAAEIEKEKRDIFMEELRLSRKVTGKKWEPEFKSVVEKFGGMSSDFIKENASFFQPRELNILLLSYGMNEEFLEQYFTVLDPVVIACHQSFSENFFMKHFNELNYNNVLKKGVNEWRFKEKRSKQLDVFLRLKGISI